MTEPTGTVAYFESPDGILLIGPDDALATIDREAGQLARKLSAKNVTRFTGVAATGLAKAQEQSGRWLKATPETAALIKKLGSSSFGKDGLLGGVLRGDKGRIVKHMKFENLSKAGLLTPAAPMVLASMATQYALEAALDEITDYLQSLDVKLDQLLKQRKTETLGQLGGASLAIDEAATIHAATGTVSAVTWSKVQAVSLSLQTMQAEAVAQVAALADDVAAAGDDTDKAAKALERTEKDTKFWLAALARTMALQDRQYVLELARIGDEDPLQLDAHREGITVARADRVRRVVDSLESIGRAVKGVSTLSNAAKVANPINAPKVARHAAAVESAIATFAIHADLELTGLGGVQDASWWGAARGLIGEAADAVGSAGAEVAGRARAAAETVAERREQAILRKAREIEEKRRARTPGQTGATNAEGDDTEE